MLPDRKKAGTKKRNATKTQVRRSSGALLRLLPKLLMVFVVIAAGYFVHDSLMKVNAFPVEKVRIEGEFVYLDHAEIRRAIAGYSAGGFFDIDIDRIRTELLSMEWVEDAFVRREWPDALVIRVFEKVPAAIWNTKGVLTTAGELFHPDIMPEEKIMAHLKGPEGRHEYVLSEFNKIQSMLHQVNVVISEAEQDERRSWKLMINGVVIHLGRRDILKKVENFINVYAGLIQPKLDNIQQIDLRYSNGIAVSWKKQAVLKESGDSFMKKISGNSDFISGAMNYV